MDGIKKWAVFTIRSRPGLGKPIWVRIGIAFMNQDGSYNLHLDATPLDGKLQMREWREESTRAVGMGAGADPNGAASLQMEASPEMPF